MLHFKREACHVIPPQKKTLETQCLIIGSAAQLNIDL